MRQQRCAGRNSVSSRKSAVCQANFVRSEAEALWLSNLTVISLWLVGWEVVHTIISSPQHADREPQAKVKSAVAELWRCGWCLHEL